MDPNEKWLLSVFWNRALGFWRTPKAWLLLTILVGTLLLQLLVQYRVNFWNRDFFDAIARRSETGIREQAINILPLAAASLALALASVWGRMTTKREWREWLSKRLYDLWLQKKMYISCSSCPASIRRLNIGSPRMERWRRTYQSISCLACYGHCSAQ